MANLKVIAHVSALSLFWTGLLAAGLYVQATFEPKKGYYTTMYALVLLVTARYSWELIVELFGLSKMEAPADDESAKEETTKAKDDTQAMDLEANDSPSKLAHQPVRQPSKRVPYLANLKSFLVFCVVVGHAACGFGAAGAKWHLAVGAYDNMFLRVILTIGSSIQGFIMPLFFFIAAYFTAGSYGRKGAHAFLLDKSKRLLMPALFAFLLIVPLTKMMVQKVGGVEVEYMPNAGPEWFIFWLLTFDWVYSSFYEALRPIMAAPETAQQAIPRKMPGTLVRLACGLGCCGFLSFLLFYLLQQTSKSFNLGGMPIGVGSLPCDILLYAVGAYARSNNWLEGNIRDQMDINPWVLRLMVGVEFSVMITMVHLLLDDPQGPNNVLYRVVYMASAGLYCVDMCLATIDIFQMNFNFENKITKFFAKQAYAVYLTHVFVVVAWTAVFVKAYDSIATVALTFYPVAGGFTFSPMVLEGGTEGALTLGLGFLAVCVVTQLTTWPFAWCIRRIPGIGKFI